MMLSRERQTKLAVWELATRTLAQFLGLSKDAAQVTTHNARTEMSQILYGDIFDIRMLQGKLREQLEKFREQRRTMERLDRLNTI